MRELSRPQDQETIWLGIDSLENEGGPVLTDCEDCGKMVSVSHKCSNGVTAATEGLNPSAEKA